MSTLINIPKRTVPFLAKGGVWEADDIAAVTRVVTAAEGPDGNFFPMPEEARFQDELSRHEAAKVAIAVNSCGTALDLCMMALGIGPGDEVIVPGLTFVCTAGTAVARGARVVFADIDERTLCLDPSAVEAKITPRTKAVIPVHFAGLACDLDAFDRIAARHEIKIVYDAAHAVGTKYRGQGIGDRGHASCYSFQSNKNMTCLGEGGAVTTNDLALGEKVRGLKTFGYVYGAQLRVTQIGFNYRMTKPQCAAGLSQLAKIDRVIAARRQRFQQMQALLEEVEELILPAGIDSDHGCHLYVVRLNPKLVSGGRADFVQHLKEKWGVGTAHHYPAVWSWEAFAGLDYDRSNTPVTEAASRHAISLPLFPTTTETDVEYLAHALRETIAALKK